MLKRIVNRDSTQSQTGLKLILCIPWNMLHRSNPAYRATLLSLFVSGRSYVEVMKKCPVCKSAEGVRRYLYGMPSEEPDPAKFVIGGCLVSDDMPDYKCITFRTGAKLKRTPSVRTLN